MAAEGITIEEAGEVRVDAGYFHVIADDGCVEPGDAVPRDADHLHFGGGQVEGTVYLEPGSHERCLQAGDGAHIALDATDTVTVEVGITDVDQWCAVVGEVDELIGVADTSEDEFPVCQDAHENIRRLIAQLADAVDFVDADARDDMASVLELNSAAATAYVQADDEAAAARVLEPLFAEAEAQFATAEAWVLDASGIVIDG